jgi:hypothetical protein
LGILFYPVFFADNFDKIAQLMPMLSLRVRARAIELSLFTQGKSGLSDSSLQ